MSIPPVQPGRRPAASAIMRNLTLEIIEYPTPRKGAGAIIQQRELIVSGGLRRAHGVRELSREPRLA